MKQTELPADWRRYIIEMPDIFDYLKAKKISWWNLDAGEIILLSSVKRSTWHSELRTQYWYMKYNTEGDKYIQTRANEGTAHPFSAVFCRNGGDVSVKFVPQWEHATGWVTGQYIVSSSFAVDQLKLCPETQRWERYINSNETYIVEELLENILNRYPR